MAENPRKVMDALRACTHELMRRCNVLKAEKKELEEQIATQAETILNLQKDLEEMNIKYRNLLTAKGAVMTEGDVKTARGRFNKLVREIDKCISLLNE